MLQFADPDRLSNKRALEDLLKDEKHNRFWGWNWAGGVRNRENRWESTGKRERLQGEAIVIGYPLRGVIWKTSAVKSSRDL